MESAKKALRLQVAIRRVVFLGMQLPPFGPPLLDGDNAPTNEESDLIKRHFSELQHLLRDPRFRDSPLVMKLQEDLSERALFTDYPIKPTRTKLCLPRMHIKRSLKMTNGAMSMC